MNRSGMSVSRAKKSASFQRYDTFSKMHLIKKENSKFLAPKTQFCYHYYRKPDTSTQMSPLTQEMSSVINSFLHLEDASDPEAPKAHSLENSSKDVILVINVNSRKFLLICRWSLVSDMSSYVSNISFHTPLQNIQHKLSYINESHSRPPKSALWYDGEFVHNPQDNSHMYFIDTSLLVVKPVT